VVKPVAVGVTVEVMFQPISMSALCCRDAVLFGKFDVEMFFGGEVSGAV
jgi:hypothetical protein